ncbi:MAG: sigma-54-dependent Fis family transcriptional regulator, partial [Nitrospirae bacterium]|nr:sigma-54-dependent Fis family transcriptional regulator [Nitrospirota bacterium]
MSYKALIVDDEINSLKVVSATLKREGFDVETSLNAEDALERLKNNHFDIIVSDYKLPGMNGEELLDKVKVLAPATPVVLMTAYGTIERAVNAMKKGAYTYLTKPVNLNVMISVIRDAIREKDPFFREDITESYQFINIIGKSKAMREVFSMIHRVSKTDASVLILGESGTGKELVARAIHYTSLRADNPFIPIACTTIPQELMESE